MRLKNDLYKTISAFSPICSLHQSEFAKDAIKNYLNNNIEKINLYDPINLILQSKKKFNDIKIDVGVNDEFIKDLYIKDFKDACTKVGQKLSIQMHEGYDHGYYFIHSFIEDHIKFHVTTFNNL